MAAGSKAKKGLASVGDKTSAHPACYPPTSLVLSKKNKKIFTLKKPTVSFLPFLYIYKYNYIRYFKKY